jgi:DNA-binding transcriptional regulator WhiA
MFNRNNFSNNEFWYLVGLITSDGSLSKDERHISITSKDNNFLEQINKRYALELKVGIKSRGPDKNKKYYHLQIGSVTLYKELKMIGLTQNKSLTLGALQIDNKYFVDFLRGVIDGDGSISKWIHNVNKHEQWSLRIFTASKKFSEWLKKEIENTLQAHGRIHVAKRKNRKNPIYVIKFGKVASKIILQQCYYVGSVALNRKLLLAVKCIQSENGWKKYKTMKCRSAGIGRQS